MSNDRSPGIEYEQLLSRLLELLRQIRSAPFQALSGPSGRGEPAKNEERWIEVGSIGERMMELGGLDLMHAAARDVRHFSASMCDGLERSWANGIPGYKPIQWLP